MAKDLVRTRNYVTRFIEMKTHLNAVSLKMQVSPYLHAIIKQEIVSNVIP